MGIAKNFLKKVKINMSELSTPLLEWFDLNKRPLPFRKNNKPYSVWVSEIMLQQTKVDTVIPYYNAWMKKFPNIESVAEASEESVLKSWEGLGYYSRCRNFHKAAKIIIKDFNSEIPESWDDFRSLPGVGDYTAGAVLSIAFNKAYVAIDGNVKRVMARITSRKKLSQHNLSFIKSKLLKFMDKKRAGDFNQAMMELGACVCSPNTPKCEGCPINMICNAYRSGKPNEYPTKVVKRSIPSYTFVGGLIRLDSKILVQKREEKMLNGLWEIPMKKIDSQKNVARDFKEFIFNQYGMIVEINKVLSEIKHSYSHFNMKLIIIDCVKISSVEKIKNTHSWIARSQVKRYPFHKVNHKVFSLFKKETWNV
jgi:A/G-specific adenine glycosylase